MFKMGFLFLIIALTTIICAVGVMAPPAGRELSKVWDDTAAFQATNQAKNVFCSNCEVNAVIVLVLLSATSSEPRAHNLNKHTLSNANSALFALV